MSLAKMTIENAPRDVDGMMEKGRFQRRELAKQLGLTGSDEASAAFLGLDDKEQSKQLVEALKAADKQGGGGSSSDKEAAPPKRTPRTTESEKKSDGGGAVGDGAAILAAIEKLTEKVDDAIDRLERLETLGGAGLTLNLMLAEEIMKAPRNDVLGAALDDVKGVLEALSGGKGKKKGK